MIPANNDVRFEVTTFCNYNCVICPREQLRRPLTVMSDELFEDCVCKIKKCTDQYDTLTFAGLGEPMMDKRLLDKIRIAKKHGFDQMNLLTNGSLLTRDIFLQMQDAGMQTVRISFYGMTPESYSGVHGSHGNPEKFQTLCETVEELCALPRTTRLVMTFNVVPGVNDSDLKTWIDHWEDRADLIEAWHPHNWVYGRKLRAVGGVQRKSCGRPFNGPLQIQVDGTVNMCCFDFNGDLTLGDLKTQTLEEIFSAEPFTRLHDCHKSGDYFGSNFICEQCDQRNADKSDVMVYNSEFSLEERVEMTSTTYSPLGKGE